MYIDQVNAYLSFRRISPDVLPSCSPGVFRQKSFRSSTPPKKVPAPAFSTAAITTTLIPRNSRVASAAVTNDRCAPRVAATSTITIAPTPVTAVPPRDSGSRTVVGASLSLTLSRGARAASKQARLGPVLASKMASASSSTVVQGWPNTKDDYELKEVIGKYPHRTGIIRRSRDDLDAKIARAFEETRSRVTGARRRVLERLATVYFPTEGHRG